MCRVPDQRAARACARAARQASPAPSQWCASRADFSSSLSAWSSSSAFATSACPRRAALVVLAGRQRGRCRGAHQRHVEVAIGTAFLRPGKRHVIAVGRQRGLDLAARQHRHRHRLQHHRTDVYRRNQHAGGADDADGQQRAGGGGGYHGAAPRSRRSAWCSSPGGGRRHIIGVGRRHRHDEAVARLGDGLHVARGAPVVLERPAQRGDRIGNDVARHRDPAPDLFDELVVPDHLAGARRQTHQHAHDFGLELAHVVNAADAVQARHHQPLTEMKRRSLFDGHAGYPIFDWGARAGRTPAEPHQLMRIRPDQATVAPGRVFVCFLMVSRRFLIEI